MLDSRLLELAKQAGCEIRYHYDEYGWTPQEIERFANLVRQDQIKIDANLCTSVTYFDSSKDFDKGCFNCEDRILQQLKDQ